MSRYLQAMDLWFLHVFVETSEWHLILREAILEVTGEDVDEEWIRGSTGKP